MYNSDILLGDVDFGASAVLPSAQEFNAMPDVKFVPVAVFAVVPAYNVRKPSSTCCC